MAKGNDGKPPSMITPPINIMIEQIWRMAPLWQSLLYRTATTISAMNEMMQSNLEMELLIREFAEKSDITLSTPQELRKKIATDRKEWLTKILNGEAGKMDKAQEEQIKKELVELDKFLAGDERKSSIIKE